MEKHPDFDRLKGFVDAHILDFLPEIDQKSITLFDSMKYSLTGGGKRIRPVLLLAACELLGGSVNAALPYALAVEYIHTYSLVHDDLPAMDDDELRRGKPTNHMVYGEAVAILAGDGLLSSAFEAMGKDMLLYMDKPKELIPRVKALSAIAKGAGCRGMVGGQVADIEAVSKAVSPALLDYIHIGKTAALFEACVKAGGHLGGADKAGIEALSNYGENLGLAFQIADDILDVQGSQDEMGKVVGRDEELHKATYPAVHGMQESQARLIALTEAAVASLEPFGDKADFLRYVANMLTERTK